MRSLAEIAVVLRESQKRIGITQEDLRHAAGIARGTLTGMLSGRADYKVTTLMAVLDRLGCEMVIVPKGAASAFGLQSASPVKTLVDLALERSRNEGSGST